MAAITRVSREITSLSSLQVENTKLLEAEARRRREAETLSMGIQALSST